MSNFITVYLKHLRVSSEKKKHRVSIIISIIASIIVLIIIFIATNGSFFSLKINKENQKENTEKNTEENVDIPSPLSSFSNFIKDSGHQISSIRVNVSELIDGKKDSK